jgi:hypothetical protein
MAKVLGVAGTLLGRSAAEHLYRIGKGGAEEAIDTLSRYFRGVSTPSPSLKEEVWKITGEKFGYPAFIGPERRSRFEISDKAAKLRLEDRLPRPTKLMRMEEVLYHPELYEAAPYLKNIPVKFDKKLQKYNYGGSFDPSLNMVSIDPALVNNQLKSTLLHEIQHRIQHEEDFAFGINPSKFKQKENIPKEDRKSFEKVWAEREKASKERNYSKINDLDKALDELAYQAYLRTAGEVEARTVSNRMHYSPTEMIYRPFWFDWDRPPIVR